MPDAKKLLKYTYKDIQSFLKKLGPEEFRSKQNYFRWLEYPLALSLADIKENDRVLEVGSGYINVMPLFIAAQNKATVTGIDREELSEDSENHVRELAAMCRIPDDRLHITQADATNLPFDDGAFDCVLCVSTLEHIKFFNDSMAMAEIGRVLTKGGRAIVSFPFNHHGEHIETESWHGEEYSQRHYNEYTTRWRVVQPSGLWLKSATVFGETDLDVGKKYLDMNEEQRFKFCRKNADKWNRFWKLYYRIEREEFYINEDEMPDDVKQIAGLICLELEKRDDIPKKTYFDFDPVEYYLQNDKVCKTYENFGQGVTIGMVRVMNAFGTDMDVYESGQSCFVEIHFTVHGEVINPAFRVIFEDVYGNQIAGLNTYHAGYDFKHIRGAHILTISFGMLNLLQGKYDVTVGIWEYDSPNPIPPYPYDVQYRAKRITVRKRLDGLFGAAYLPYEIKFD